MESKNLELNNQICFPIYSTSRLITKAYKPFLEDLGLTYPQYLVMLALWETDQIAIKQLVERTRFDAGTLTPILKRLSLKGLITIEKSDNDSRQKIITVTTQGKELCDEAKSVPLALQCQIDMSKEDAQQLKALTEQLYRLLKKSKPD